MNSANVPSRADQQLIDHARGHGFEVTGERLYWWRRHKLLPANTHGGGLGRGLGSTSQPVADSFTLVPALARLSGRGKRPTDLALLLFGEGLPVPEATVRAAFHAAVDTLRLPGSAESGQDLEEQLDAVDRHIASGGQTVAMVPKRARRVDEQIAAFFQSAGVPWPPAELAQWDENPGAERMTPQGATLFAADALLTGSAPLPRIAALLRAMTPGLEVNPIASLVETTVRDVPDSPVLGPDDSLSTLTGDARRTLHELAATASPDDLAAAWQAVRDVRTWALDLCTRAEAELAAQAPGDATTEWWISRQLPAGFSPGGTAHPTENSDPYRSVRPGTADAARATRHDRPDAARLPMGPRTDARLSTPTRPYLSGPALHHSRLNRACPAGPRRAASTLTCSSTAPAATPFPASGWEAPGGPLLIVRHVPELAGRGHRGLLVCGDVVQVARARRAARSWAVRTVEAMTARS